MHNPLTLREFLNSDGGSLITGIAIALFLFAIVVGLALVAS